jgi:uncharacterized membrane protein
MFKRKSKKYADQPNTGIFVTMTIAAAAALIAAFTLTVEKFHLYEEPDAVLSCSINLVLNCSTVMQSWQSHVFGFPNMILGLIGFSVVLTIAVLGLAKVQFPRWFLIATNIGLLFAAGFAYWLFFQSVYAIQVLCPWCLLVTTATTLMFSSILHYNLKHNTFKFGKKAYEKIQTFLAGGYHQMIVIGWFVVLFALVYLKFGADLFA